MLDFSVTFIITIVNITILYFILRKILFKPVTKFMNARAKKIQDSIDQAEYNKSEAKELLAKYEDKLKNIEVEETEILRVARKNAAIEAKRIIAEGREEAADIIVQTRKQLEIERQATLAKFNAEAAVLVMAASSKLISRELSGDDNRHYVNILLDELISQKGRI